MRRKDCRFFPWRRIIGHILARLYGHESFGWRFLTSSPTNVCFHWNIDACFISLKNHHSNKFHWHNHWGSSSHWIISIWTCARDCQRQRSYVLSRYSCRTHSSPLRLGHIGYSSYTVEVQLLLLLPMFTIGNDLFLFRLHTCQILRNDVHRGITLAE